MDKTLVRILANRVLINPNVLKQFATPGAKNRPGSFLSRIRFISWFLDNHYSISKCIRTHF